MICVNHLVTKRKTIKTKENKKITERNKTLRKKDSDKNECFVSC